METLKVTHLEISGTIDPGGTLANTVGKALSGVVGLAGALTWQVGKRISGAIALIGALTIEGGVSAARMLTPRAQRLTASVARQVMTLGGRRQNVNLFGSEDANLDLRGQDTDLTPPHED